MGNTSERALTTCINNTAVNTNVNLLTNGVTYNTDDAHNLIFSNGDSPMVIDVGGTQLRMILLYNNRVPAGMNYQTGYQGLKCKMKVTPM